ncbi:hypothetical protein XBP1_2170041 [Xenorhabdus bovienii str. puntauvense]|uniref:Uncharacterized protein n=4 Tax=Xenorhabdus bovienii TaxID=40576 RepID=A0A0B6X3E0_XENBV|nr:hypothetical protein XBFFR1_40011 [Xenorhabdus bovienii str. feltiae France]CDG90787.1 hypothetical protein XBFFL1_110011 [Xenorhabdus bovienii str. feltiae Florida]CDG96576.1 hypothetical protein XBP1_2170041 [Xenorhabdus bovienii str. puntauvense]CDH01129.1 hypothetical protein XBFM1_1980037 [Xenorhabdus bovienii str. feltiae Moldova]CDH22873.1 hypothetical protein XBKB1_140026 [Xenorhabdus bovienii str. kraussei Becker Underwood]CDM88267.1 protein of unknown function [Xenorhabdus bovieni
MDGAADNATIHS